MRRDVIVVLGAAVRADGQPSQALQRRVGHAIDLARERPTALLLFTGGLGIHAPCEADAMAALAGAAGIEPERIRCERHATNTAESARLTARMLREMEFELASSSAPGGGLESGGDFERGAVILVTDPYHQRRTRLAFRRMGVRAVSSSPPGSPPASGARWLREWIGLAWYRLTLR